MSAKRAFWSVVVVIGWWVTVLLALAVLPGPPTLALLGSLAITVHAMVEAGWLK